MPKYIFIAIKKALHYCKAYLVLEVVPLEPLIILFYFIKTSRFYYINTGFNQHYKENKNKLNKAKLNLLGPSVGP